MFKIKRQLQNQISALVGHILHHYDTSIFGWAVPFLAPIFFPKLGRLEALLAAFSLLPLSFIGKPIGAFFWGWVGDRWGRKPVLIWSLMGIAGSTFFIGCLPLGDGAWIGLLFLRVIQGFCSSGEEKGAALYLLEQTEEKKRSWMSAVYDASGIIGILLASLLVTRSGQEHWRYLFWFGSLIAGVGVWLRRFAEESPGFEPTTIDFAVLWRERNSICKIICVSGFSYANYYLISLFLNGFLPEVTSLTTKDALTFNSHLLWIDALLLLGCGILCRWIPKTRMMAAGALSAALLAVPLFMSLEGASFLWAASVRLIFVVFGVALAAPYHAWAIEIAPPNHRFLIGNIGAALGAKCLGAPMPAIATFLVMQTGWIGAAALPIVLTGLLAAFALIYSSQARLTQHPCRLDSYHS